MFGFNWDETAFMDRVDSVFDDCEFKKKWVDSETLTSPRP